MYINNIKIINHNYTIDNADVEIKDGIIVQIIPKSGMGNNILIPGFIDSHIHGYQGLGVTDSLLSLQTISKNLLEIGVTSFVPTVMSDKWHNLKTSLNMIAKCAKSNQQILGIHLEGPFISPIKKGAHNLAHLIKPTPEKISELFNFSKNLLVKITFAPEQADDLKAIINTMRNHKIIPSIGHTDASVQTIKQAIKDGATSVTHLWNAMSGVSNRNPGTVTIILNSEKVIAEIICDFIHIDQETLLLTLKAKSPAQLLIVSDAIKPSGLKDGAYESGGLTVYKKGDLITLKDNTIAGSNSSLYQGFKNLITIMHDHPHLLTLNDIVAMTSFNAATSLNQRHLGQIAVRKKADLLILNNQYDIIEVISNGKCVKKNNVINITKE